MFRVEWSVVEWPVLLLRNSMSLCFSERRCSIVFYYFFDGGNVLAMERVVCIIKTAEVAHGILNRSLSQENVYVYIYLYSSFSRGRVGAFT